MFSVVEDIMHCSCICQIPSCSRWPGRGFSGLTGHIKSRSLNKASSRSLSSLYSCSLLVQRPPEDVLDDVLQLQHGAWLLGVREHGVLVRNPSITAATSPSRCSLTHYFLRRREDPKRLGGFFKITCSWSEMGWEYQSEFFVVVVKQATETVSAE